MGSGGDSGRGAIEGCWGDAGGYVVERRSEVGGSRGEEAEVTENVMEGF